MRIALGFGPQGHSVQLSDEERSRHMHVLGASGTGKSKFLESMIRSDIRAGRGLCLIDPHGTLADAVVRWCAATGMEGERRIHVIEPANLSWCTAFNPLCASGPIEIDVRVDAMLTACAQVWGGEETNATPLLKKCLRAVFYALAVQGLTLAEAPYLTSTESPLRASLSSALADPIFDSLWRDFRALSRREFSEQFSSTNNRLLEFLSSPVVRRMVGQHARSLNLRSIMDGREIIIVNLAPKGVLSDDNARVIGTLLTSELFLQALGRDEETARHRPFTLYIDECHKFLTSNVVRMLDESRKFGLHAVLSHQRLGQLRRNSEDVFNGVMTGGQTKIVFGGLSDEDGTEIAREVMRSTFDLERPKHILDKPVVIGEELTWLATESESHTWAQTEQVGEADQVGSVSTLSAGWSESYTDSGIRVGFNNTTGSSAGESETWITSRSTSKTEGSGRTHGRAQAMRPVRRTMPTAVHSLEEVQHLAVTEIRDLPNREAIMRRRGQPPIRFRTRDIRPAIASQERVARFLERVRVQSPYQLTTQMADDEIEQRRKGLAHLGVPSPTDNPPFWAEEG